MRHDEGADDKERRLSTILSDMYSSISVISTSCVRRVIRLDVGNLDSVVKVKF